MSFIQAYGFVLSVLAVAPGLHHAALPRKSTDCSRLSFNDFAAQRYEYSKIGSWNFFLMLSGVWGTDYDNSVSTPAALISTALRCSALTSVKMCYVAPSRLLAEFAQRGIPKSEKRFLPKLSVRCFAQPHMPYPGEGMRFLLLCCKAALLILEVCVFSLFCLSKFSKALTKLIPRTVAK